MNTEYHNTSRRRRDIEAATQYIFSIDPDEDDSPGCMALISCISCPFVTSVLCLALCDLTVYKIKENCLYPLFYDRLCDE